MKIKNITICGAGVLGGQIAYQTAYHKYSVVVYDINEEALEKVKITFKSLSNTYKKDLNATQENVDLAISRITFTTDLKEATKDAELIIEAIPENLRIKKKFYLQFGKVAPAKSIFCTNSSMLLPSMFAKETGRPERFLALHFANIIWKHNTAEIMGHEATDPKVFNTIIEFAKTIGTKMLKKLLMYYRKTLLTKENLEFQQVKDFIGILTLLMKVKTSLKSDLMIIKNVTR